jgi:hypothetical protein
MADTDRNRTAVCKLFLSDRPEISQRQIWSTGEGGVPAVADLDRVPPPPIPTFPDDDPDMILTDGTKPAIAQQRNLAARLRKFAAWQ